MRTLCTFSILV